MSKLKIFDACEEVMRMSMPQLLAAKNQFDWRYLRQALDELRDYLAMISVISIPPTTDDEITCTH